MTEFGTWDRQTLNQFAKECHEKVKEQEREINEMRDDLRTVLTNYRKVLVENARKTN